MADNTLRSQLMQQEVQRQVRAQVSQALEKRDDRSLYGVPTVPFHTHNGVDSVQVKVEDLDSINQYIALATVTLTPTQVKALNTTPIELVQAFGANICTIVEGITAYIAYKGTAYTGANALEFRYTDGSGTKVTADIPNTFINSTSNTVNHAPAVTTTFAPVANAKIVVRVPTANPATGNSPITFVVKYRVVPTNYL